MGRAAALPCPSLVRSLIRAPEGGNLSYRSDAFSDIVRGLRWCRARIAFVPSTIPTQAQPRGQTLSLSEAAAGLSTAAARVKEKTTIL